jgi:hypothetical protein
MTYEHPLPRSFFLLPEAYQAMPTQLPSWVHPTIADVKCKNSDVWITGKSARNQALVRDANGASRPMVAVTCIESKNESVPHAARTQ